MDLVAEFRAFNRFYTRRIGLLRQALPGGELSLPMARVLYEIATAAEPPTSAALMRGLEIDKAHLSRLLARLRARALIEGRPAAGRRVTLALTGEGRAAFAALDRASGQAIEALIGDATPAQRARLAGAFADIHDALDGGGGGAIALRPLAPGDVGWITHRQGLLYHREYGWDLTFEALAARILADFVERFDPSREAAYVADRGGAVIGSAFLMRGDAPEAAKLRLLYVEPHARGEGLGARLVEAVIAQARAFGYRALALWTNDVLSAARKIYLAKNFRLVEQTPLRAFGADLVSQTWRLDL